MRVSRYAIAVLAAGLTLSLVLPLAGCGDEPTQSVSTEAPAPEADPATTPDDYSDVPENTSDSEDAAPEPSEDDLATDDSDPEYQLAVIDGHDAPTNGEIAVYAAVLKRLQKKCKNTQTQLSDYAVTTRDLLRKNHSEETTLLEILTGMRRSIPRGYLRRDCKDLFATFVTLMRPESGGR